MPHANMSCARPSTKHVSMCFAYQTHPVRQCTTTRQLENVGDLYVAQPRRRCTSPGTAQLLAKSLTRGALRKAASKASRCIGVF